MRFSTSLALLCLTIVPLHGLMAQDGAKPTTPELNKKVLAFALTLPESAEDTPWEDDLVVMVRGKIFVFLGAEGSTSISVKLAESHAHALTIEGSQPTGYGLGRAGWVTVPLRAPGVTVALLRDWVEESYRIVAPKGLVGQLDTR